MKHESENSPIYANGCLQRRYRYNVKSGLELPETSHSTQSSQNQTETGCVSRQFKHLTKHFIHHICDGARLVMQC
jgi:hypothetical protein